MREFKLGEKVWVWMYIHERFIFKECTIESERLSNTNPDYFYYKVNMYYGQAQSEVMLIGEKHLFTKEEAIAKRLQDYEGQGEEGNCCVHYR